MIKGLLTLGPWFGLSAIMGLPALGQTNLSITPADELKYSRSSGTVYQLQSSRDLASCTNAYYAVLGTSRRR
jgi:hypothetical protein